MPHQPVLDQSKMFPRDLCHLMPHQPVPLGTKDHRPALQLSSTTGWCHDVSSVELSSSQGTAFSGTSLNDETAVLLLTTY